LTTSKARRTPVRPVFERLTPGRSTNAARGSDVHALLAEALAEGHRTYSPALLDLINRRARQLTQGRRHGRADAAEAASFTCLYFRNGMCPDEDWELLGTGLEYDGLVDHSWIHTETGQIFHDEIKTTRVVHSVPDPAWIKQARRYLEAGLERHGHLFLGVRLVPLGSLDAARLLMPDGTTRTLRATPAQPLSVAPASRAASHGSAGMAAQ
jgi:hypothetical protein